MSADLQQRFKDVQRLLHSAPHHSLEVALDPLVNCDREVSL
jgi:hypothetical protein